MGFDGFDNISCDRIAVILSIIIDSVTKVADPLSVLPTPHILSQRASSHLLATLLVRHHLDLHHQKPARQAKALRYLRCLTLICQIFMVDHQQGSQCTLLQHPHYQVGTEATKDYF